MHHSPDHNRGMLHVNKYHQRVCGYAALNYVTYSAWTMMNKNLFSIATNTSDNAGSTATTTASPLLCTALQMFTAAMVAWVLVVHVGIQRSPGVDLLDRSVWRRRIVPLGLSRAVDIGCGNYALSLVTVALQQIVKATLPIFVTLLSVTVLRRRVTVGTLISLLPIVMGTVLASVMPQRQHHGNVPSLPPPSMIGVGLAFLSCFGRASKAVLNALLLSGAGSGGGGKKLRPMEIVLLEAPTTGLMILLPALILEGPSIASGTSHFVRQPLSTLALNVMCGVLMFATQVAYVTLIDETSALSCQVLMSVKMLFLVFFSVWWHDTPFTWINIAGVMVAGAGCVAYARAAHSQESAAALKKHDISVASPSSIV